MHPKSSDRTRRLMRLIGDLPVGTPVAFERVALQMIAAICDIVDRGPEDLVTVTASDVRARKTATARRANVVELDCSVRPRRATI